MGGGALEPKPRVTIRVHSKFLGSHGTHAGAARAEWSLFAVSLAQLGRLSEVLSPRCGISEKVATLVELCQEQQDVTKNRFLLRKASVFDVSAHAAEESSQLRNGDGYRIDRGRAEDRFEFCVEKFDVEMRDLPGVCGCAVDSRNRVAD
jgi:hypothetical protein